MSQFNRPTAAEWHKHLSHILTQGGLSRCARFPRDYRHIKFAGMPCPQCDREARTDVLTKQPPIAAKTNSPKQPPIQTVVSPAPVPSPRPAASAHWALKMFIYLMTAVIVVALISDIQDNAGPTKNSNTGPSESMPTHRSSGSQNNSVNNTTSKTAPSSVPVSGSGRYLFSNGDRYIGNFFDSRPHGNGAMYYANGKKYIGEWKRGLRDGMGSLYSADGALIYHGHWKGDEPTAMSTPRAATPVNRRAEPKSTSPDPETAAEDAKPRYDELTARIQRELARLGFKPGPIDGYYGPRTRNAILNFQGANGLRKDGQISSQLLEKLANTPARSAPELKSNKTIGRVLTVFAKQNYFELELFGVPDVRVGDLLLIESANVTARLEKIVGMKASAVVLRGNIRLISSNAIIKKIN